ncbi:MAG: hypothetical protein A2W93_15520 [Bacteroidetes bacterium GWF2_43_63]|nr:MAG: hypothetical protein A2W94_05290 [Bacteroidetes bacterium GWE2_42_42]OFY53428.1 MAG: hypothetical protein A2W93_15520 [Bacteroidetes bacterium GWF2_43_63]HBG69398.1 hypothetical protein [Bacteroidales bacterium]HCB62017.1 hypothetical protein [Bacteroidales bacterium]HCY23147.1 hypothetical protein [Bacteroidales bacterium]
MKKLQLIFLILFTSFAARSQDLLCSWHFDTLLVAPNTDVVIPADSGSQDGSATIYLDGTNGSSLFNTATGGELSAFGGSTVNDGRTTPLATLSLCPINTTANGKGAVIRFSTTGYENPIITYAARNTSTGFQNQFIEYSTDGVTFTRCDTISGLTTTFVLKTIDLSAFDVLDEAANVYIRIIFDGATSSTGNNRVDNITINATSTSATDIVPPTVLGANATSLTDIWVRFSEPVGASAEVTTNYTGVGTITSATRTTGLDSVHIVLATPLTFGVADTICIANVADVTGNVMISNPCFQVVFGTLDVTPPTAISAWPANLATVKVKFSEAMDNVTAETVANYTGLAGIGSATLNATLDTVTLALSINLVSGIADTLYVQNVEDTAGNAMAAMQQFVLFMDTSTTVANLVITEIMYNPAESGTDSTEFIEILNNGSTAVNLMNYTITYGTSTHTITTSNVVNPGDRFLIAPKAVVASNFYGVSFYQGSTFGIGNNGATVKILNGSGIVVDSVMYDDVAPWPTAADEGGYSLSLCDPSLDNNAGSSWSLGTVFFSTINTHDVYADPGQGCVVPVDNTPPVVDTAFATNLNTVKVVFNEVVDNITAETIANYTGLAGIGAASLNATMDTVTLTLSTPLLDNVADTIHIAGIEDTAGNVMATTQSFRLIFSIADIIPPTVINAWPETHAVVKVKFSEVMDNVTAETVANYTGLAGIGSATLNATMDTVTLALSTNLINGVSDTLYIQNVEDTAGNAMAAQQMFVLFIDTVTIPKALVITEIMYNPAESGTDSTEFIEIYNNDVVSVDLLNYVLNYGASTFTFPSSLVIAPGEYALVSSNATAASNFYGVTFLQGSTGGIGNGGATIVLLSPTGLLVDTVTYDDVAPWPTLADEGGYSLSLCDPTLDNNVGSNWGLGTIFFGTVNTHDVYADPGEGCSATADTVPPVALSASLTNLTTAVVTFNEALDLASAQTTGNYTGLGTVSTAVLTSSTVVTLTLSTPLVNAQNYVLEVTGISDLASNVMALTYQFPLMLDTTTSISEIENSNIQIFPNPASDVINLTGVSSADRIEVYSNMGMLVMSREADGNDSVIIETSVLSNGLYYINIRMKDGAVETKPVVIIR